MILLLSQNFLEYTTDDVIDWIDYYKYPFRRINGIDFYKKVDIKLDNEVFEIDGLQLADIGVVWFRRWIAPQNAGQLLPKREDLEVSHVLLQFTEYLREEYKSLAVYLFSFFPIEKRFSKIYESEINKLNVLKKASELGLDIPTTYILTRREQLQRIMKEKQLISKSISNSPSIKFSGKIFLAYTSVIDKIPDEVSNVFAPSLFQDLVNKRYEIRSFLLNRQLYSMAIFSQSDEQTKVDFRRYNDDEPNRTVPFKLPKEVEIKLLKLAEYFELKAGSFDLIRTVEGRYLFLEVNPEGQFGMVSYPCNYHLEKKFAEELINQCKENGH